jgi:hypothetical protein
MDRDAVELGLIGELADGTGTQTQTRQIDDGIGLMEPNMIELLQEIGLIKF